MKPVFHVEPPEHAERDSYVESSKAMRASIELAIDEGITLREWRIFAAVLSLTAGYSRIGDRAYLDQLVQMSALPRRHAQSSLHRLHERAVIFWQPAQGRGKASWVGLRPPTYLALTPLMNVVRESESLSEPAVNNTEKVTGSGHLLAVDNPEKVTGSSHLLAEEKVTGSGHLLGGKGDRLEHEKVTGSGHPTEKLNEKGKPHGVFLREQQLLDWVNRIGWQYPTDRNVRDELARMGVSGSKAEYLVVVAADLRRERAAA